MVKKEITKLPNPEANRLPIVNECLGGKEYEAIEKRKKVTRVTKDCDRIFTSEDGTKVCCAYEDPAAVQRIGCGLASNKTETKEEIQKINPIKMSKRKNR